MAKIEQSVLSHPPVVLIILVVVLVVHLWMQFQFWFRPDRNLFEKYGKRYPDPIDAARRAYFAKAAWLVTFVFGIALNFSFGAVLVVTFFLYAVITACWFGWRGYPLVQLMFAAVMMILAIVGGNVF